MTAAALRVEGITKRFGSVTALAGASFDLHGGELLGLIGPNGAGKTTLLECVAGARSADAGRVSLGDAELAMRDRKHSLFFLPDGIRPWPQQRVSWLLGFMEELFRTAAARRLELIDALGLATLLDKAVGVLSKGERKRVLVALGLLTPQPFLLLDEPFDGLDLRQARDVASVLRAHADRGRGLCLSIHQLQDAARLCDRLVLLADGRTAGEGTMQELRSRAALGPDAPAGIEEVFLALT
ncbi:MAG: ABC transporter ATP-binding protein [Gemmatimonadales bacterium]